MSKVSVKDKQESLEFLRGLFDGVESPRVFTVLRHVSSSGMSRDVSCLVVVDGALRDISWHVARVTGFTLRDSHGRWVVRVSGCGMDMGFHVVYALSHYLFDGQDRAGYVIKHEWA